MVVSYRQFSIVFLFVALLFACKQDQEKVADNSDSVLISLQKLISAEPNNAELYIQRSEYLASQGSYESAIADNQKAITIDSLQPRYYHLLSDLYLDYYQSKNALNILQQAQHRFPDDIKTQLKLSEDYFILKDYENALIHAHKARNIDAQSGEAFFMIGMINKETNQPEFAIKSFQQAVEFDPTITDAWILLGNLYEEQKDTRAIQYYKAAVEVDTTNVQAWHSMAFYMQNHDQVDEALDIYQKIQRLDKQYEPAYLNAGILYLTLDSLDKAYANFNILVNTAPTNSLGFYYRGVTNQRKGEIDLAVQDYQTALTFDSKNIKALQALDTLKTQ